MTESNPVRHLSEDEGQEASGLYRDRTVTKTVETS